jgi:hypothetical protein
LCSEKARGPDQQSASVHGGGKPMSRARLKILRW